MKLFCVTVLVYTLVGVQALLPADYFYSSCLTPIITNNAVADLVKEYDPEDYMSVYGTYCENQDIMVTLFDCMITSAEMSTEMGFSHAHRKLKSSYDTMRYYCKLYYGAPHTLNYQEITAAWNAAPKPFVNYYTANETLQLPFTVPKDVMAPLIAPAQGEGDSYYDTAQYSYWTLYYVVICVGLATIFNLLTWLMPKGAELTANSFLGRFVRRYITMAPLWNDRLARWTHFHSNRLPAFEIFGYFVMNYVMMSVNYRYIEGGEYASRAQAIGYWLGYRSGIMPMFKLPFLFFFAGRNNFLIWMTGWDYNVFSMWHRWLARFATLDVLIHWAAYSVGVATIPGELAEEWGLWYWIAGVIATLVMVIMCIQGSVWLRRIAYEFFLYTHIFWAILFLIFTWYHVVYVTYPMSTMYASFAVWGFDRLLRLIRMASSGVCTANITIGSDHVMVVDIVDKNPVRAYPGCHVFVYFMGWRHFYQSHPFTAIKTDTGLRLYIKSWNGMTKRIRKMALDNGGKITMKVIVEGPYGPPMNLKAFNELVCVAGGIGITAIYSHLSQRILSGSMSGQKVTLHWIVRNEEFFSTFAEDLKKFADAGIRIVLHVTGHSSAGPHSESSVASSSDAESKEKALENVSSQIYELENGRPNILEMVPLYMVNATGSLGFMTCGPASLNHDVRAAVSSNIYKTKRYVQCYEEGFEM
ncbi:Ferric reductase transmembrane component 3 [Wickerhamiella sorbophila]|uniref:Ferric reductase transmembrane component 3 n=1 Tax=Wickerhamiella sorbophila TaxID=45607 RepID=A0A2T0FLE2_9ASCO|nr:Ferric reductase transmembrane component 3 [Wickerhamiella sorbophila]PRT55792.1 Ferric reductase transmembrane component 3 [Wickerhamiella sorbophila]